MALDLCQCKEIRSESNVKDMPNMWNQYAKPTFVLILIFFAVFCVAYLFENHSEHQCSEKCRSAGAKGYEYKGTSGYRSNLKPRTCTCLK
jgi:hypothetical protein